MILVYGKSKVLKQWKELDNRITDLANEAKDNVKYLDTIEKSCQPLYQSDPVSMIAAIPKLINAIQMITACKEYLTDKRKNKIWDQARGPLIEKIESCVNLNKEYQNVFQKTKQRIEADPSEK